MLPTSFLSYGQSLGTPMKGGERLKTVNVSINSEIIKYRELIIHNQLSTIFAKTRILRELFIDISFTYDISLVLQ